MLNIANAPTLFTLGPMHLYAAGLNSLAQVVPNSPKFEIKGGDQSVQVTP